MNDVTSFYLSGHSCFGYIRSHKLNLPQNVNKPSIVKLKLTLTSLIFSSGPIPLADLSFSKLALDDTSQIEQEATCAGQPLV